MSEENMDTHRENLARVREKIQPIIYEFCLRHIGPERRFHMVELTDYVFERVPYIAPASTDRVFRDMRQREMLDYTNVSRKDSLYEITSIS